MVRLFIFGLLIFILPACSSNGIKKIFKKSSPHERYIQKLEAAGLKNTVLGQQWINASQNSLTKPLTINVPYQETGYFSAQEIKAVALRFTVKRGEQLRISLTGRPTQLMMYLDLWEYKQDGPPALLAFADTLGNTLTYDADGETDFILRLQPELLSGGEYTLIIKKGPTLAYPVADPATNKVQSIFGQGRDNGIRLHEGIDLFSAFRTPVVAAAPGTVTRVNTNNLGGKVVFMRPEGKDYSLYYAHLDTQLVTAGQSVAVGDTLGLMGNTGNARTTPPHLHFGIYTSAGAIDPLPFIDLREYPVAKIAADTAKLGLSMRPKRAVKFYSSDVQDPAATTIAAYTPVLAEAATGDIYKVSLPDNRMGFIRAKDLFPLTSVIDKRVLKSPAQVFDLPDTSAARQTTLESGIAVNIIGRFNGFDLTKLPNGLVGWLKGGD